MVVFPHIQGKEGLCILVYKGRNEWLCVLVYKGRQKGLTRRFESNLQNNCSLNPQSFSLSIRKDRKIDTYIDRYINR